MADHSEQTREGARLTKQTSSASGSIGGADTQAGGSTDKAPARTKAKRSRRRLTAAACFACRTRKVKCNGARPCESCNSRSEICVYNVEQDETQRQALRRRLNQLTESTDTYAELYRLMATRDERDAAAIFRRIRNGEDAAQVLRLVKHGDVLSQMAVNAPQFARRSLLVDLMQSMAPLSDIIEAAQSLLASAPHLTRAGGPAQAFRNRVHQLEVLQFEPDLTTQSATPPQRQPSTTWNAPFPEGTPVYTVPCQPWTLFVSDDRVMSHWVSIYCNWFNGLYRMVEPDLLVQGMRSQNLKSKFASPMLVHAICSVSCMASQNEEAFDQPGEMMTRGLRFHKEALRLWLVEEGRPSLPTLQALLVLFLDCAFRGKDKLSMVLLSAAIQMNQDLPLGDGTEDYTRARRLAAWSTYHVDVTSTVSMLKSTDSFASWQRYLPDLKDTLDDVDLDEHWTGYPTKAKWLVYKPFAVHKERSKLALLIEEAAQLLFGRKGPARRHHFISQFRSLVLRMEQWYEQLPDGFVYTAQQTPCVYELHAQYLGTIMILAGTARNQILDDSLWHAPKVDITSIASDVSELAQEMLDRTTQCAKRSADVLADFRRTRGLTIHPGFMIQLAVITPLNLLQSISVAQASEAPDVVSSNGDLEVAFEESYRCLLASAIQNLIGRAVAHMVWQTSRHLEVRLSDGLVRLLNLVAETAWDAQDLAQFSSQYPNWGMGAKGLEDRDHQMLEMFRKWDMLSVQDDTARSDQTEGGG